MAIQNIRSEEEQPFNVAFARLREAMYGEHPYSMSVLGKEETVAAIVREDLEEFHRTYFRPDNMVVSIVGKISTQAAITAIDKVFGDWQVPPTPLPPVDLPEVISQPCQQITEKETQQTIAILSYLAPTFQDRDYVTLKLLSTYLGNGLSSRLFVELREKRGLAYEVSAIYPSRLDSSYFAVYMGTAPENTPVAVEMLQAEVERLRAVTLSEKEIQTAKNKLLGQYALSKQTNAQIAHIFGWYETMGKGVDFDRQFPAAVASVTPEMLQAAARSYFARPYISLVGPQRSLVALANK